MKSRTLRKLLGSLAFFACASVSAAPMTLAVDVTGIQSFGFTDEPGNVIQEYNIGANSTITSITYNVGLTAFAPSTLAEIGLLLENSTSDAFAFLTPADGPDDLRSGSGTYSDIVDLVADGTSFAVGADGILRLQFAELFNDEEIVPDGIWYFGTITIGYDTVDAEVPEPTTTLLLGAGLAMMGYAGRRRRSAAKRAA